MLSLEELIEDRIIIDRLDTWPQHVLSYIENEGKTIHQYLKFEREIDERAITEVALRFRKPKNPYLKKWLEVLNKIEDNLKDCKLVGFHCTKLTQDEIDNVLRNGLEPLSPGLTNRRLKDLFDNKFMDSESYKELINNNQSNETNRSGLIWYTLCSTVFKKNEGGLFRFFKLWGGESIYKHNEHNPKIKKVLSSVGKPCIVLLDLCYDGIHWFSPDSLAYRMIKIYAGRNASDFTSFDSDCYIKEKAKVISVISSDDDLFEKLTGFSTWTMR